MTAIQSFVIFCAATFADTAGGGYLGLDDIDNEGEYKWLDGTPLNFSFFQLTDL